MILIQGVSFFYRQDLGLCNYIIILGFFFFSLHVSMQKCNGPPSCRVDCGVSHVDKVNFSKSPENWEDVTYYLTRFRNLVCFSITELEDAM